MSDREPGGGRVLELIAVLLLGITTVGTAWCGLQAAQWNGRSSDLAQIASQRQTEGARLFGLATQRVSYDSTVAAKYAEASQQGNTALTQFYRRSVVRPDFLPVLDRWEAAVRAGDAAVGAFQDQAYLTAQFADYTQATAQALQAADESRQAGEIANGYIATTIMLAVALFFAGVTSSFRHRPARVLLLLAALAATTFAAARLAGFPVS
jgi:hypothetical protein